jgi:hypothetical protein
MRSNETRYCEVCNKAFNPIYRRKAEKPQAFCSRACYQRARWGEPVAIISCQICGKPANSSRKRTQKYCSAECRLQGLKGKPRPTSRNRITIPCSWCGDDVTRPASNFHSEHVFCNYRCMAEWQSEFNVADAHPRWKGGVPRTYGIGWKSARLACVRRADGTCERCKKHPLKHVHHLLPVRYFECLEDAHFASNLIAVCYRCHAIEHRNLAKALPLLDLLISKR